MSEQTVWMRIDLHSSQWPSEAMWAQGALSWALELAGEQEPALKSYKIYRAKNLGNGQTGNVALMAQVEAKDFEAASDLLLNLIDHGLEVVSERNSQGITYKYNGGAVEEEGYQDDFLRVLKSEFLIDPEPPQPLTPQRLAYEAAARKRQETLTEAMEAMFGGKPEEPSI